MSRSTKGAGRRSNKDAAKKQRERFFLEQFLAAARMPLQIVTERETPDFLLRDDRGELGVELAELFKDRQRSSGHGKLESPGKAIEAKRAAFLRQVAKDYYAAGGRPISVQALLPTGLETAGHHGRPVLDLPDARDVVQALLDQRPVEGEAPASIDLGTELEPGAVFYVRALPDAWGSYSRWTAVDNSVGLRRQAHLSDAQVMVDAKAAAKLAECRKISPRVVLLLHADGTRSSGMMTWADDFAPIEPRGFDEVWLYLHPGEAWRLWRHPARRLGGDASARHEAAS